MRCREVRELLSLYLDSRVSQEQTEQIEIHLLTCVNCHHHLELLQTIPVALQTDRMLAPRPEFTRLVMQKIIVQQQIGNNRYDTQISQISVSVELGSGSADASELLEDEDESDAAQPAKIISLAERRANRPRTTAEVALRLSALAAALVLMVGAGVYIATGPGGTTDSSTAAAYGAIKNFGDALLSAISNPLEVIIGIVAAIAVVIIIGYMLRSSRQAAATTAQTQNEQQLN